MDAETKRGDSMKVRSLLFLMVIFPGSCGQRTSTEEKSRPNIIFLLADDMRVGAISY